MGADRFPHGQRDENVEKRSGRQHYQDGFCESVYSAKHGAAAHFASRHIFALPFCLALCGAIDFDAGDYDQDDDYDDEIDHVFFRSRPGYSNRNRLSCYGLNIFFTPSRRTGTVCPSTEARNSIRAHPDSARSVSPESPIR